MNKKQKASGVFVLLAVIVLIHHAYIHNGIWFQIEDIMSHEFFVGVFVTSAIILFYSDKIIRWLS